MLLLKIAIAQTDGKAEQSSMYEKEWLYRHSLQLENNPTTGTNREEILEGKIFLRFVRLFKASFSVSSSRMLRSTSRAILHTKLWLHTHQACQKVQHEGVVNKTLVWWHQAMSRTEPLRFSRNTFRWYNKFQDSRSSQGSDSQVIADQGGASGGHLA